MSAVVPDDEMDCVFDGGHFSCCNVVCVSGKSGE